ARDRRWSQSIWIAPFLLGMAASTLLFLAAWRLCLGYWPATSLVTLVAARLSVWSSGFGGMRYGGDLMPLALLAWSIFILIQFAMTASRRISAADSVRIGAAAIALVWLPYYANRPDFWNLSSFGVLYAIAAIDAVRCLMVGVRRRRPPDLATVSALALTAIV